MVNNKYLMEIQYYLATEEDIPLLIQYRVEFMYEFMYEFVKEVAANDVETLKNNLDIYLRRAIPAKIFIAWYARCGDAFAGMGGIIIREMAPNILNLTGMQGYIVNMYTLPQFRKQGISSSILSRLIDSAKEQGVTSFELHASPSGEPVYIKRGFKLHGEPTYRMVE
jgi:GNAT superfamily N-acetyltransferase